jgi:hypothetical protein
MTRLLKNYLRKISMALALPKVTLFKFIKAKKMRKREKKKSK